MHSLLLFRTHVLNRLWYQACVNASISYGHAQSALDTHPLTPSSSHSDVEQDLSTSELRTAQRGVLDNSISMIEDDEWTSGSAASSDSETIATQNRNLSATQTVSGQEPNPTTAGVTKVAEDGRDEDNYVTDSEAPSSPETPPPRPLPTKPSFKNQAAAIPLRSKSRVNVAASATEGKNGVARGKKNTIANKGHARKKSTGGKPKTTTKRAGTDSSDSRETGLNHGTKTEVEVGNSGTEDLDIIEKGGRIASTAQAEPSASPPLSETVRPIVAAKPTSSTTYSSSTPKASSYPTPSQSFVPSQSHGAGSSVNASVHAPPGFARSRSHLDTGTSARHSHSGRLEGEWGNIWGQWRRAGERSFGEVVDDVFKVVRVEDLVPQRVQSREMVSPAKEMPKAHDVDILESDRSKEAVADENTQTSNMIKSTDPGIIAWESLSGTSRKPQFVLDDEISPRTTPGIRNYKESPLRANHDSPDSMQPTIGSPTIVSPAKGVSESLETDAIEPKSRRESVATTDEANTSRRESVATTDEANTSNPATPGHVISIGPVVRVVEPTPAPSRVGSAGELTLLGGRLLASNAISHSFSKLKRQTSSGRRHTGADTLPANVSMNFSSPSSVQSGARLEPLTSMGDADSMPGNKPSTIRRTSSDRSDRSGLSRGASTPGSPRIEIEDPMEAAGAQQTSPPAQNPKSQQSPLLSSSVLRQLNDAATSRSSKSAHKKQRHSEQQHQHQSQQSGKKNKKSIFFIQSPGDNRNRQASARHGSISGGSEASTEPDGGSFAGSSVGLPGPDSAKSLNRHRLSSVASTATSPLSQEIPHGNVVDDKKAQPAEKSARAKMTHHDKSSTREPPLAPARALSDTAAPSTHRRTSATSKASSSSANLKRTASTAHASGHGHGHGHGHAHRTSIHHMTHVTGGHAKNHTTAAANAAGAKRTDSMSNMAGRLREMKANAAAAISARLEAQQKAEKEKQTEQRNKLLAAKRQRSEPDLLAIQQRLTQQAGQYDDDPDDDDAYEDIEDDGANDSDGANDDDEWSSATDESAKDTGLQIGKIKSKPKRDPAAIAAAKTAAAEEDAKRKRELFAKRAIFGTGGMSGMSMLNPPVSQKDPKHDTTVTSVKPIPRPGGLTNLFEKQRDVLRRGDSMVSLVSKITGEVGSYTNTDITGRTLTLCTTPSPCDSGYEAERRHLIWAWIDVAEQE
ncbi:hypothetical protein QFC19_008917 [Naganishia cerealis]|uniref:Uncharacterized protein n=1 Tax=Naganishia cerealis TaxID=610337 RepID=A0ACC2UZ43_9TREE|nr:hypothetical protein QFC19_008917 [Naganishia cerealis]